MTWLQFCTLSLCKARSHSSLESDKLSLNVASYYNIFAWFLDTAYNRSSLMPITTPIKHISRQEFVFSKTKPFPLRLVYLYTQFDFVVILLAFNPLGAFKKRLEPTSSHIWSRKAGLADGTRKEQSECLKTHALLTWSYSGSESPSAILRSRHTPNRWAYFPCWNCYYNVYPCVPENHTCRKDFTVQGPYIPTT
jgi:hypothetical protein